MNQHRLNKSNSTSNMMPINQQPNPFLFAGNNVLQPDNKKYYVISKTDNDFYRKQKKLHKSYKKNINAIKDYLESDKIDRKIKLCVPVLERFKTNTSSSM